MEKLTLESLLADLKSLGRTCTTLENAYYYKIESRIIIAPSESQTLKNIFFDDAVMSSVRKETGITEIVFLSLDCCTGFGEYKKRANREACFEQIQTNADVAFNNFRWRFFQGLVPLNNFTDTKFINVVIPYWKL